MRYRCWAALVWAAAAIPVCGATTLLLQVCDVHDRPLSGIVLSAKSGGSTSPPTDVAGKTQIMLLENLQPGESVILVLVRTPRSDLRFYSPWEGFATIPRPSGAIAVVLGSPGDRAALENRKVTYSLAGAVLTKQESHGNLHTFGRQKPSTPDSLGALSFVSTGVGLDPLEVDDAIRGRASGAPTAQPSPPTDERKMDKPMTRDTLVRYLELMPSHEALANYAKPASPRPQ